MRILPSSPPQDFHCPPPPPPPTPHPRPLPPPLSIKEHFSLVGKCLFAALHVMPKELAF